MRILSQDGKYDFPYDLAMLSVEKIKGDKYGIYTQGTFIGSASNDNYLKIAEYTTEEKAKMAIDLLKEAYISHFMFESMTSEQKSVFVVSVSEREQECLYGVFKFPVDSEVLYK